VPPHQHCEELLVKISWITILFLALLAILCHTVWHTQAVAIAKFLVGLFILLMNLFVGGNISGGTTLS
jgi:hypothetical protein